MPPFSASAGFVFPEESSTILSVIATVSPRIECERSRGTQEKSRSLSVLALFAGVGGIERGLELAGHHTVAAYEIDEAAKAVLGHRFPSIAVHHGIHALEGIDPCIDLVTAGFPCVDLSQAGRMVGLDGKSSGLIRHHAKSRRALS
jgi:hypothetical protein